MEELKLLLEKVPDAYNDFVGCIYRDAIRHPGILEPLIAYLKEHPEAQTDDIIEYVDDELIGF